MEANGAPLAVVAATFLAGGGAAGAEDVAGSYVYQLVDEAGEPVYYGISNNSQVAESTDL